MCIRDSSYTVELDGVRPYFHANKLRKFYVRVDLVTYDSFVSDLESVSVNTCAIVYDHDAEFGDLNVIPSTLVQPSTIVLPSMKIDPATISHLNRDQQSELLEVLDKNLECFSDVAGYTDVVAHTTPLTDDFKPKRLSAYRIPEKLKPKVDRQIQEMLRNDIIRPSQSPMASPLVCVLKAGRRFVPRYCSLESDDTYHDAGGVGAVACYWLDGG